MLTVALMNLANLRFAAVRNMQPSVAIFSITLRPPFLLNAKLKFPVH